MKSLTMVLFSIYTINLFSQNVNHQKDWENIYKRYYEEFNKQIWCPINAYDSTFVVYQMCDTNTFLNYGNQKYIAAVQRREDSLNMTLDKHFRRKDNKLNENTLRIKNGFHWFFMDNLDLTGISTDYSYLITVAIDVNCKGEIYNLRLHSFSGSEKTNFRSINEFKYTQIITLAERVFQCIKKMPRLQPAVFNGKKVNQRNLIIETRYSKDVFRVNAKVIQ
jgi:hypothetical protein